LLSDFPDSIDVSSWSLAKHKLLLNPPRIVPGVVLSLKYAGIPFSQDDVKKLVNDLGFSDRFFVNIIFGRRLSSQITTRTGDCWLMCDWQFYAVSLQRTQNNDIISILISDLEHTYSNVEPLMNRYISSKAYCRHPLFPILLGADASLENYRDRSDHILALSEDLHDTFGVSFRHGGSKVPQNYQRDIAADLADIASERERLARILGGLKAFHASVQNLLHFNDGMSVNPSLTSMLQCLISGSGEMLDKITATDARFGFLFFVVRICPRTGPEVHSWCTDHA
jgi:hypothetical protein